MEEGKKNAQRIIPDTSSVIDGIVSAGVERGDYRDHEVCIPEAVVAELEAQANRGLEIGFRGLEELQRLQEMATEGAIKIHFCGKETKSRSGETRKRGRDRCPYT